MSQATLGRSGEIVLPADVRHALGLEPGDAVRFAIAENGVVTMLSTRSFSLALRTGGQPDRPTPHGARTPVDVANDETALPKGQAARGLDALRNGPGRSPRDPQGDQ